MSAHGNRADCESCCGWCFGWKLLVFPENVFPLLSLDSCLLSG